MAKSKGRLLAELLASDGKVKESKSALDISGGKLAPSDIPVLPNSKLENSSISIAGHSTSLGGSVTLDTGDIGEHTNYKYYTEGRARGAISASSGGGHGSVSYNASTGALSVTGVSTEAIQDVVGAMFSSNTESGITVTYDDADGTIDLSVTALNTGNVTEGSNLYYTDARARAAISATGSLSYNSTTGVMSFTMPAQNTSNITEGSNLYYTNARADARITNALKDEDDMASDSATHIPSQQSVKAYVDAQILTKDNTDEIAEGSSNLYYTNARARAAISENSTQLAYNSTTGVLTFTQGNTDTVSEGSSNLYYTNARADARITNAGSANWNTAYGWGDHASGGYAPIASPGLTGTPTAPTAAANTNTTQIATTAFVQTELTDLIDGAPGTLDTLNELAAAINDDANYNTTLTTALATKLPKSGGAMTGAITTNSTFDGRNVSVDGAKLDGIATSANNYVLPFTNNSANWNTAYGWGNHASAGYYAASNPSGYTNDQTAAEILTAIKTVDGSGSGLDADLLDGMNSSSSVVANTIVARQANGYIYANHINFNTSESENPTINSFFTSNGDGWSRKSTKAHVISQLGLYTTSNDGSGSGLDADLLDGQHGSYYAPATGGSYLPLAGGNITGAQIAFTASSNGDKKLNFSGHGGASGYNYFLGAANDGGNKAVMFVNGSSRTADGGINTFTIRNDAGPINVGRSSQTTKLLGSGSLLFNGNTVWHAGNDGSGSGLDADLLDGQHGSYYAPIGNLGNYLPLAGGTMTGDLHLANNVGLTSTTTGEALRVLFPGGAARKNSGSSETGAIKVTLPVGMTNSMLSFKITVYQYNTDDSFEVHVGGYNYPTGLTWTHNPFGYITGSPKAGHGPYAIRFGYDSNSKACVYIGETTTVWSYPQIAVTEALVGYAAYTNTSWDDNWDVSIATSFENVTHTIAATDTSTVGWHPYNDGSGSGLDADLLDGQQGSYYLPTSGKAADSDLFDGHNSDRFVFGTSGRGTTNGGFASLTNSKSGFYDVSNSGTPTGTWYSLVNMAHYGGNHGHQIAGSFYSHDLYHRYNNNTSLSSWSRIWSSLCDGSGSGLDADLFDGVDSPVFFKSPSNVSGWQNSNANFSVRGGQSTSVGLHMEQSNGTFGFQLYGASGTYGFLDGEWAGWDIQKVANGTFKVDEGSGLKRVLNEANWSSYITLPTDADTIDGRGFVNTGSNSSQNADSINSNGISYYTSGVSNFSGNATDGALFSQQYSTSWQHQIAGDYRSGQIALRGKNNGTWQSWRKVWDVSNDGSGSGLDADYLDGLDLHTGRNNEANKVVRTNASGYIDTGYINTSVGTEALSSDWTKVYASTDNYIRPYGKSDFKVRMGLTAHQYDRMDYTSGTQYHTGANSHNDTTFNGLLQRGCGFIDNWNNGTGRPPTTGGTHWNGFQAMHYASGSSYFHGMQMAMTAGNPSYTYLRGWWANGGSGYGWQKIWTDGNDGSGSGLDADLLDGQHGSYYATSGHGHTGLAVSSWGGIKSSTSAGYIEFGPANTSHAHIYTDRPNFYFNKQLLVNGSTVWNAGNDGSGSGLDADLLDGLDSSAFATLSGSNSFTNSYNEFGNNTGAVSNDGGWNARVNISGTAHARLDLFEDGDNAKMSLTTHVGYSGRIGMNSSTALELLTAGTVRMTIPSNSGLVTTTGQGTLWGASNDGSGSGLDADTLDGLNLSASTTNNGANLVMRTDANGYANFGWIYTASGGASGTLARIYCSQDGYLRYLSPNSLGTSWLRENIYNNLIDSTGAGGNINTVFQNGRSGNIDVWSGSNLPSGATHVQGIQCRHSDAGHYGFQLVNQYNQQQMFHRQISNSSFGAWNKIWSSSTDGSGSGLDADLLDGNHASSFITTSTTNASALYIRNTSPTVYLRDTDHNASMLHCNSNIFYILRGATDSTTWTQSGGKWPMELSLTSNSVTFGGNVTAYSDVSLKENIKPIGNSMEMFEQIDAKRFDWIVDGKKDIGFIAQDVQAAGLNEVVIEKENRDPGTGELLDTKLTLDYSRMVSVLWDVVKEQQAQIDKLNQDMEDLKNKIK